MIRRTRILALIGLVAGTLTLALAGAGVATALGGGGMASAAHPLELAAIQHGLTKVQQHRVELLRNADVSTRAGANRLLRALGYNPRQFVVQRGARNYAGLKCPGKRWTCTKATRVLQAGGQNVSECTPPSDATINISNDCEILQVNGGSARCVQRSKDSGMLTQICRIEQGSNSSGNRAEIVQSVDQNDKGLAAQLVNQKANIFQDTTGSGSNFASINQGVTQSVQGNKSGASIDQNQQTNQSAVVRQGATGSGDNNADVSQTTNQDEHAENADMINQFQNAGPGGFAHCNANVNVCFDLTQTSNTGKNNTNLNQKLSQSQFAVHATTGGQQAQGGCDMTFTPCHPDFFASGLDHTFDQSSTGGGLSTQQSNQDENQQQRRTDTGGMTFSQVGPVRKGLSFQDGNDNNQATQFQNSKQSSKGDGVGVLLSDFLIDDCSSSGLCTVHQQVDSNGFRQSNDETAPSFEAVIACGAANETEEGPFCVAEQNSFPD